MHEEYTTGYELILNACEGVLQIAVTLDEAPLCFQQWNSTRRATEILAPALRDMCHALRMRPTDFRRIACFAGPGSFTGIRLVLTTASALRRAGSAQLASLDYLQALATSAVIRRGALYPTPVFALTHARRNLVHMGQFISYGAQIPAQPAQEVTLVTPEEALREIAKKPCLVCGSALERYPELFSLPITGQGPAQAPAATLLPDLIHPDLQALCLLARHGDYFPKDVEPKYVRGCDAVENLSEKLGADAPELRKISELLQTPPSSDI